MEGFSVYSIVADHFRLIVFSERRETPMDGTVLILLLVGIWLGSLLLVCPLSFFRTLKHFPLKSKCPGVRMTMALVLAAAISVNDNWNSHRCATKYLAAMMAA